MKTLFIRCLVVGAAGFVGAIARYLVSLLAGRINLNFPLGTFVINVWGCLFLGWFLGFSGSRNVSEFTKLALGVGFVGAYTTFSTFCYESNSLLSDGSEIKALVNLIGSVVVGLIAVRLGIALARS